MGRQWGKEGESFHACFPAAQCWLGTVAEQGSAWSATVRDLILLTMWVLSPTIVVIFVQCIDCFGWDFWLMGCCPQISPYLYH